MRDFIYHDIETVPTQDEKIREQIAASVLPPANYSKAETIAKWEAETKPAAVRSALHATGLDGGLGHVVCICFAAGDRDPDGLIIDNIKDEADLIRESFTKIEAARNFSRPLTMVGHNWIGFDHRFITHRAIVLGVRLPAWWPRDPKPWAQDVHDTMLMWAGPRDRISMGRLCGYLGLDGKDEGMDGSRVADRWEAKDFLNIIEYCADDVRRTRSMHRMILTAFGEEFAEPVISAAPAVEPVDDVVRY